MPNGNEQTVDYGSLFEGLSIIGFEEEPQELIATEVTEEAIDYSTLFEDLSIDIGTEEQEAVSVSELFKDLEVDIRSEEHTSELQSH